MKKIISAFLMITVVMFSMTACLEEETSKIDVTGSATVKGVIFADMDGTESGNERVSGATVRATYDAGDLDINNDGDTRLITLETTTDDNGAYSFEVPTSPNQIDVTITLDDFEGQYTYYDGNEGQNVTVDAIYKYTSSYSVYNLKIGETKAAIDLAYNLRTVRN